MRDILEQLGTSEYTLWMLLKLHPEPLCLGCASTLTFHHHSLLAAMAQSCPLPTFSLIPESTGVWITPHAHLQAGGLSPHVSQSLSIGYGEEQGSLGQF